MTKVTFFVSYARVDAEDRDTTTGSRMGELLEDLIRDLGGNSDRSDVAFLRDSTGVVSIGDDLDVSINDAIDHCDFGLIFLSRAYCQSKECAKELHRFVELNKKILMIELDEVWATETDHLLNDLKPKIERTLTKRFWTKVDDRISKIGNPTPRTCSATKKVAYDDAVEELVSDIRKQVNEKKLEKKQNSPVLATPATPDTFDVLMASPTSDVKRYADRLEESFVKKGFSVLRIDHLSGDPTAQEMQDYISRAGIYVQLLGALLGKPDFGDNGKRQVVFQHDAALAVEADILAWRSPEVGLQECDDRFQDYVTDMSLQIVSFEEFEQYAGKRIAQVIETRKTPKRNNEAPDVPPMVAIDAAPDDRQIANLISSELSKYVDVNQISYDDPNNAELNKATKENDAIIIVYGETPNGQKRAYSHFKLLRRLRWNAEQRRLEIAVGDAEPKHAPPCPKGPNIHIITVKDTVDTSGMSAFLSSLGVNEQFDPVGV